MPSLSELNTCSEAQFVAALGNIFEHSPWIAARAAQQRPFASSRRSVRGDDACAE